MPSPSGPTLQTIPHDIQLQILLHLHDSSPSTIYSLSQTTRRLSTLTRTIRHAGETALPVTLSSHALLHPGISAVSNANGLTLRKTARPGDALVIFDRDISATCAYWQLRLHRFKGHRIDVGVATLDAFRFGSVERASSWSFDCFGRASLAGRRRTYGRQMREGDVLAIVFDFSRGTLSFLDQGVSMGALNIRRPCQEGPPLFPFVYFPYHEGEAVSLINRVSDPISMAHMYHSEARWCRPPGLPYDGKIIVHTWEEHTWYAFEVDCATTTLAVLWNLVQERHGLAMHLFELICSGDRLENTEDKTLEDAGIAIDRRTGTCRNDILLSVPHIVS